MPNKTLLAVTAAILTVLPTTANAAQAVEKPRLAIQDIVATDAVRNQARASGQLNVLEQIMQGADSQLANTINATKRFDIVARSKYRTILKEQEISDSGDIDPSDPQRARAFKMAGARYVATVTVDNYQDITSRFVIEGGFGDSAGERRVIQLQATLEIFDTTTSVMLESAMLTLEDADTNEIIAGTRQDGRATNKLIGNITRQFAVGSANLIMDALVPAKVLAYTMGNVTFNRGQGTGVEVGQYWQIFHPGEALIDPDTGENLGSEEIPLGWARVTAVLPKFSKAQAIQDFGINRSNIMRSSPTGLPADVDPNARATGSAVGAAPTAAPVRGSAPVTNPGTAPTATPTSARPAQVASAGKPIKLALFIRDVAPDVPDQKVLVLENYLTAWLTSNQVEVINRADVINAVSSFATEGSNSGTNDPMQTQAVRLLSDQSSALALARNLGADGLAIATIVSLVKDTREIRDPQRGNYNNEFYSLDVTWNVLDGTTGGSLASGLVQANEGMRQTTTQTRTFNIDPLLSDAAKKAGQAMKAAMARPGQRRPTVATGSIPVQVRIALADLSVPEIVEQPDGSYAIGANRYSLEPMACNVIVDGMLAGTAPGVVNISPGPHRIRIERPMIESVDKFMVVRPNMTLTIPVACSDEGRRQWMEQTAFFEGLKDKAVMRTVELEKAKAMAEFLRNSQFKIDTQNLRNLGINTPTIWQQWLGE
ncbi:MAG: hypothetical protein MK085_08935 [Phycisphaerales bacterium]|nr:hypothetical protein [Phycisphaerales bacterium]